MMRQPLQQLQKELWNRKRRNSGSSIVIVIIAMAMIGILATTLLWMSYVNYKIKVNDIRNKNSFYSAETVMEQIVAGLQKESSDAVAIAYKEALSNWDRDDDGIQSEANHYSSFATAYLDALVKELRNSEEGAGYYNRDVLKSYVDTEIWKNVNQTAWNNGTDDTDEAKTKAPVMEIVNGSSLILRNVFVSYVDGDRLSIVSTDLCLDVPQIVFTKSSSSIDDLYDYLLIGNRGISLTKGSGQVTGDGSIYAGIDETTAKGGIVINPASSLAINNGRYVISKGEIDVVGPGAGFIVRDARETGSSVYAKGLDLQSGMISLDSKTYIANDLTLSGNGSKATLTKEYYGYGTSMATGLEGSPTDQENSSAIIINGQNSTVDMSGVNTLMLAGRAYIGTNTTKKELDQNTAAAVEDAGKKNEKAVLMGESITVKGGQIAYLVPTECLGVYNGETLIGQNPLTQDQAAKMQAYKDQYGKEFREVDFTRPVSRLGGQTLASFGVADMDHIRKVSTQYVGGGTESKSLTYYYLVMDADKAAEYYRICYQQDSNKEMIDNYFKKYATGGILLGDYNSKQNSYTILGNALVSDALSQSGVSLLTGADTTTDRTLTPAEVFQKSGEIANVYKGLTTKLSEDGASASPLQNVFESVIKKEITTKQEDGSEQKESIQEYLMHKGTGGTMEFVTEDGLKGIITTGNYTLSSASGGASNVRLIISLGDIMIDRNFTGLAIAKGTITIDGATGKGAASLKRNKMELYKVLNATTGTEGDTITPMAFFVNGEAGLADGVQEAPADDVGNLNIDYTEIVRYMNWEKR